MASSCSTCWIRCATACWPAAFRAPPSIAWRSRSRAAMTVFADPKLQDVLDQIELRAHVELAKLEMLDKRVA